MSLIEIETARRFPGDAYWVDQRVRAMGSEARIVAGDAPADAISWAVAELEWLEQCWSRFRPDSELSALNAQAGEWTEVSAPMLLALTCSADLHRATRGCFDPTILEALERAGYDRSFELVRETDAHDGPPGESAPGFDGLEVDFQRASVCLPRGTRIDLGGIGKGLAADLLARGLIDRGARSALVEIGGDMRARGEAPAEGPWRIPVEDPFNPSRVAFEVEIDDGAVVASTTQIRTWKHGARTHHHLIDPTTGRSARTGVAAVVATGRDAWWTEGVAKAIVVAGAGVGTAIAQDTGVRAWIFLDDGRMLPTDQTC
jgi:thiamine biosynthesis lipoprotein